MMLILGLKYAVLMSKMCVLELKQLCLKRVWKFPKSKQNLYFKEDSGLNSILRRMVQVESDERLICRK